VAAGRRADEGGWEEGRRGQQRPWWQVGRPDHGWERLGAEEGGLGNC
jgi:hypothetical protein